ncbi:glycine cleavage system aminomethyltransferase GcvT [uncultured Alistipes sp.]|uniref:glycine cleavage system aminomethyltransferase GcvT n=1 Tax=uncultured Alistipes sp. TaxID=538949 RepID=UPI00262B5B75|nr:glycine cleavage system aminomethyltransferase GcvT [uncultured Alistipes sp.]
MKTTAFTKYHIENGARMAEFAGYDMPIEFSGINNEHAAVREKAGVFDVSHMGEIWVKGPRALGFLQRVTSNDVSALWDGKIQYSCLPNGRGGIVDDILVYRIDAETYLLVVNAANIDKDWNHLKAEAEKCGLAVGKELYNASDEIAQLAVQGPLAMKIVQKLCPETDVENMPYYTFVKTKVAGIADAIVSATGYTGAGGCEIYVANEDADKLWSALWEAGAEYGLQNIGLGARDTLRLEMGFCLYGNDIDDTTSPLEAGLGWITKFVEGKDFIDRAALEAQKAQGVGRRLVGFELIERGVPRHGYALVAADGTPIGTVTSGTMSPTLKKGIGMGYVDAAHAAAGTEIAVVIREKPIRAQVVKTPFVKK